MTASTTTSRLLMQRSSIGHNYRKTMNLITIFSIITLNVMAADIYSFPPESSSSAITTPLISSDSSSSSSSSSHAIVSLPTTTTNDNNTEEKSKNLPDPTDITHLVAPLNEDARRDILTILANSTDHCNAHSDDCLDCYAYSSSCHFCEFDNQCHTIGSIYGCLYGIDCDHHPNSTNPNSTDTNSTTDDDHCAAHSSCAECSSSSSLCHWCDFDEQCHAIGSIYGCLTGSDCSPHTPTPAPTYSPNSTACASHKNCTECSLSSSFCHWCAFDDACHAIGSIYGCLSGVDCYANDVCQRMEAEKRKSFMTVSWGVFFLSLFLFGMSVGCLNLLFRCVRAGKGAYDDLDLLMGGNREVMEERLRMGGGSGLGESEELMGSVPKEVNVKKGKTSGNPFVEMSSLWARKPSDDVVSENYDLLLDAADDELSGSASFTPSTPPRPPPNSVFRKFHVPEPPTLIPEKPTSKNINEMFTICRIFYYVSMVLLVTVFIVVLFYYPRYPEYNFCSDQFDWNSIISSMTSMKLSASYQLLISVYNPNRFDINLDMGTGTLSHDGAYVGTIEVPSGVAKAQSINDYLVTVTFTPDQWEALRLTSEYYMGTLTFLVDAQIAVTVPRLWNYGFTTKFENYLIHLSDVGDRSLCSCPSWSDLN